MKHEDCYAFMCASKFLTKVLMKLIFCSRFTLATTIDRIESQMHKNFPMKYPPVINIIPTSEKRVINPRVDNNPKDIPWNIKEIKFLPDLYVPNWKPIYAGNIAAPQGLKAAAIPAKNANIMGISIF